VYVHLASRQAQRRPGPNATATASVRGAGLGRLHRRLPVRRGRTVPRGPTDGRHGDLGLGPNPPRAAASKLLPARSRHIPSPAHLAGAGVWGAVRTSEANRSGWPGANQETRTGELVAASRPPLGREHPGANGATGEGTRGSACRAAAEVSSARRLADRTMASTSSAARADRRVRPRRGVSPTEAPNGTVPAQGGKHRYHAENGRNWGALRRPYTGLRSLPVSPWACPASEVGSCHWCRQGWCRERASCWTSPTRRPRSWPKSSRRSR
jgi:hypothetical protein